MKIKETILQFKGSIRYDTVSLLIRRLQDEFDKRGMSITVYKKVLIIMIEVLENIYKYCDENCIEANKKKGIQPEILILRESETFFIKASNPVLKADALIIRHRIDTINSLDETGLLELYKHTITNGRFSEKGGAGIGLMEIARVAHDPLHYEFSPLDATHEYYTLSVTIV